MPELARFIWRASVGGDHYVAIDADHAFSGYEKQFRNAYGEAKMTPVTCIALHLIPVSGHLVRSGRAKLQQS
jgi:hypothetical protein